jgi:hypothetical protein
VAGSKYFDNESTDPVDELYRMNAALQRRVSDLEREVRNKGAPVPIPRLDILTHPNPYEGQRAIDTVDEQHAWYSDGRWRKAIAAVYHIKVFGDDQIVVAGDAPGVKRFGIWAIEEDIAGMELALPPFRGIEIDVTTVSSSGIVQVQLRNIDNGNVDMLSTRVQVDAGETHSRTAATTAVVNDATNNVSHGDRIAIDIDGAGTGAKGLGLVAKFQAPIPP